MYRFEKGCSRGVRRPCSKGRSPEHSHRTLATSEGVGAVALLRSIVLGGELGRPVTDRSSDRALHDVPRLEALLHELVDLVPSGRVLQEVARDELRQADETTGAVAIT